MVLYNGVKSLTINTNLRGNLYKLDQSGVVNCYKKLTCPMHLIGQYMDFYFSCLIFLVLSLLFENWIKYFIGNPWITLLYHRLSPCFMGYNTIFQAFHMSSFPRLMLEAMLRVSLWWSLAWFPWMIDVILLLWCWL